MRGGRRTISTTTSKPRVNEAVASSREPVRPTAEDGPQKTAYTMQPTGSTLRTLSRRAGRIAKVVIVCGAVVAASGCSHGKNSAKPSSAPQSGVDALIVSVEDVRKIANAEDLTLHPHADLRKPPPGDANAPGPCRAVGHSDLTFGTGWTEFRSAGYNGVTDDIEPGGVALVNSVTQAVARYSDSSAARGAFHQLELTLQACADLKDPNYTFNLGRRIP
jgi:PknH-like extracellular domain